MRAHSLLLTGLLLMLLPGGTRAQELTFHVAADGKDANPGTRERPFATFGRAREAVRALKRQHGGAPRSPVTVLVRGGTHRLTEPLLLTAEDSGTAACPVTWRAFPGETPVLSGGRRVTGWK